MTQVNNKLAMLEKETTKLRQLYETERNKNIELSAKLHQGEQGEQQHRQNQQQLVDRAKTDYENLKTKSDSDDQKINQMETEKKIVGKNG